MNRELLERPFAPEQVRQRQGYFGNALDYVEGHTVIQRLNDALDGNWGFDVIEHQIFQELDEVLVLGRLTTHGLTKTQFGSSTVKRAKETGDIICMADAFKAAATDALKKCATLLGVGLDLYGNSDPPPAHCPERVGSGSPGLNATSHKRRNDRGRVTAKQRQYLLNLAKGRGLNQKQLSDHCVQAYGAGLDFIKRKEASALIEALSAGQLHSVSSPPSSGYLN